MGQTHLTVQASSINIHKQQQLLCKKHDVPTVLIILLQQYETTKSTASSEKELEDLQTQFTFT